MDGKYQLGNRSGTRKRGPGVWVRRFVHAAAAVLVVATAVLLTACPNPVVAPPGPAEAPALSPSPGDYTSDLAVTITAATAGSTIHYTTDGTEPSTESPVYDTPIEVAGDGAEMTIRAVAVADGFLESEVSEGRYRVAYEQAATPTFDPEPGTFTTVQSVSITSSNEEAVIFYTTDGTDPDESSTEYSEAIDISGYGTSLTIKAKAYADGMAASEIVDGTFVIADQAAQPTANPAGGTFSEDTEVELSSSTPDAQIHYTLDGSTPTSSSTQYSGPISVSGDGTVFTIKAISVAEGFADSAVTEEVYTIDYGTASTPQFSPAGDTYESDQSVTITTSTSGATIYYTTDGSTPTTDSTEYTAPVVVAGSGTSVTIKAVAAAPGFDDSTAADSTYTIDYPDAAAPSFSPAAGSYTTDQSVTISTTTPDATIHFTTDGTTPTNASPEFTSTIDVVGDGSSVTIKALAVADGHDDSAVAEATIEIDFASAATPQFSPAGGTYTSDQSVTITTATSGATIYYTTDGSEPDTDSLEYSGPIPIAGDGSTWTFKAIAVADGYKNSAVGQATYDIDYPDAATPEFSPAGGTYTSDQTVAITTVTSGATIYYTTDGSTPTTGSTEYTGAVDVAGDGTTTTVKAIAVASGFTNSAVAEATFEIDYSRVEGPVLSMPEPYVSGRKVTISTGTPGATILYTQDGTAPTYSGTPDAFTPTGTTLVYTSPLTLTTNDTSSTDHTIRALAIADGYKDSHESFKVFTIVPGRIVTNNNKSGTGSLYAAVTGAQDGWTIGFDGNYTIYLGAPSPFSIPIDDDITIDGGDYDVTIDGGYGHRHFSVAASTTVELKNLTLWRGTAKSGSTPDDGGSILVNSGADVTIENVVFDDNGTGNFDTHGGSIYNDGGTVSIVDSTFKDGRVRLNGGAIATVNSGTVTIRDSVFVRNESYHTTTTYGGGAIWAASGTTTNIIDSMFAENNAETSFTYSARHGGVIRAEGTVNITGSLFAENSADGYGGVFHVLDTADVSVDNTVFANNVSSAIFPYDDLVNVAYLEPDGSTYGTLEFTNSSFADDGTQASAVTNSAFSGGFEAVTSPATYTYTMAAGIDSGTGNIDADASFVDLPDAGTDGTWGTEDDDWGDMRLVAGSSGIGAGNNSDVVKDALDADGDTITLTEDAPDYADGARIQGGTVDMGAVEQ